MSLPYDGIGRAMLWPRALCTHHHHSVGSHAAQSDQRLAGQIDPLGEHAARNGWQQGGPSLRRSARSAFCRCSAAMARCCTSPRDRGRRIRCATFSNNDKLRLRGLTTELKHAISAGAPVVMWAPCQHRGRSVAVARALPSVWATRCALDAPGRCSAGCLTAMGWTQRARH